jgi:amino acid transporter
MGKDTSLNRRLGLSLLTLYGLGTILGAGIYVLIGKVAGLAGMHAPLAFLIAALLAAFTGYAYARLSARLPKSAGEAVYISEAFQSPMLSTIIGWLVILTGIVSSATLVDGFVGYLSAYFESQHLITTIIVVLVIALLASAGIAESVSTASVITLIEVLGLLIVIWVLRENFLYLPARLPELIPPLDKNAWQGIALATFLAFYAFIGFEDMVNVAEEVIKPGYTLPMAIFLAMLISTTLYICVSLLSIMTLPPQQLSQSSAPMVLLLEQKNTQLAYIVGLISLAAVINGALIQIIMGARVLYGMSCQHLAPACFGSIHPKTKTPVIATFSVAVAIALFAIAFPLVTLAKLTSFIVLIIFMLVNASLFTISLREKPAPTWFSADVIIPIVGCMLCFLLLIMQLASVF